MPGEQIVGEPGAAQNVFGEKDATELPPQSMGKGENTAVAEAWMDRNKAAYAFDQGSPGSILRPLVGYPSNAAPSKPTDKSIET
jgi:hypothetical protein